MSTILIVGNYYLPLIKMPLLLAGRKLDLILKALFNVDLINK